MKRFSAYCTAMFLLAASTAGAQTKFGNTVLLDKTVHNFGNVLLSDGPVSCSFSVTNISDKPVAIYSVVSSCGCTGVEWTKAPIAAGKSGTIKATYTNDEGPYPFEKTLTAYVSGLSTPVILRLRGTSVQKKEPLEKAYPVHLGALALKETEMKAGNLEQGGSVTEEVLVANISKSPLKVEFRNIDPDLSVSLTPSPVPAGSTATLRFTVNADRERWGRNWYEATPVVAGTEYAPLRFWAVTKENFGKMSQKEKSSAARPVFDNSTVSFGKVKAGKKIEAVFTVTNNGKTEFLVHKADCDFSGVSMPPFPKVAPGAKASWKVSLDTSELPAGEALVIISLITNSPSRPLVNLFLTGWID
ncbi:MAG: DUF1573 domain-containing protein [Bacteroidales bacterium]|nr:DUF1573 domain-containing protein [Bacteroidales bacterium]